MGKHVGLWYKSNDSKQINTRVSSHEYLLGPGCGRARLEQLDRLCLGYAKWAETFGTMLGIPRQGTRQNFILLHQPCLTECIH